VVVVAKGVDPDHLTPARNARGLQGLKLLPVQPAEELPRCLQRPTCSLPSLTARQGALPCLQRCSPIYARGGRSCWRHRERTLRHPLWFVRTRESLWHRTIPRGFRQLRPNFVPALSFVPNWAPTARPMPSAPSISTESPMPSRKFCRAPRKLPDLLNRGQHTGLGRLEARQGHRDCDRPERAAARAG
jgi:hypothetical protein